VSELTSNIADFISVHHRFKGRKTICVYGDLMVDIYEQVHVSRLSPEFPIPVIDTTHTQALMRPGGAGNVCEQFRHFAANVYLFSFINGVGNDFRVNGHTFNTHTCLQCQCQVPIKRRYYDEDFPLCRMDNELPHYGLWKPHEEREALLKKFIKFADENKINSVIISDYNKGVFDPDIANRLISACRDRKITTIVDPKKNPLQWEGCSIFKPNLREAADFLRVTTTEFLAKWQDRIRDLKTMVNCGSVIVTNGGKGVFGLADDKFFNYIPEHPAEDVRSVIGAGDSFAAVLALTQAHGYYVEEAVQIAYEAAAVYVQKKHNEPVWPHELLGRVQPNKAKILMSCELQRICDEYRGKKKIVFTNGGIDIMHRGHVSTLEFAKKQGDILIVALNDDESLRRLKGPNRPVNGLCDRCIVVAAMGCVDFVTSFYEDTPAEIIKTLKPDVVVKGGDYKPEEVVGHEMCQVVIAPFVDGSSTTKTIDKLREL